LIFAVAAVVIVVSFCTAGPYIDKADYKAHFYWPIFVLGAASALSTFIKCTLKAT